MGKFKLGSLIGDGRKTLSDLRSILAQKEEIDSMVEERRLRYYAPRNAMLKMPPKFVGLDLEATASQSTGRIIQVGVAVVNDTGGADLFSTYVRPHGEWGKDFLVDPEAMAVNKITEEMLADAPDTDQADVKTFAFLEEKVKFPQRLVAVGWNVGNFDIPYVKRELVFTRKRFGYQTVDLNALLFTMSIAFNLKFDKMKGECKGFAAAMMEKLGYGQNWHDAGYDALAGLYSWQWIMDALKSDEIIMRLMELRIGDKKRGEL